MQKIPTIFERDWEGDRSRVLDQPVSGTEWVFEGEGNALRKYDGTCVMLDTEGKWWARREVKDGKTPPPGFMSSGHDHITLKNVGWEPVEQSPFGKFTRGPQSAMNCSFAANATRRYDPAGDVRADRARRCRATQRRRRRTS